MKTKEFNNGKVVLDHDGVLRIIKKPGSESFASKIQFYAEAALQLAGEEKFPLILDIRDGQREMPDSLKSIIEEAVRLDSCTRGIAILVAKDAVKWSDNFLLFFYRNKTNIKIHVDEWKAKFWLDELKVV